MTLSPVTAQGFFKVGSSFDGSSYFIVGLALFLVFEVSFIAIFLSARFYNTDGLNIMVGWVIQITDITSIDFGKLAHCYWYTGKQTETSNCRRV